MEIDGIGTMRLPNGVFLANSTTPEAGNQAYVGHGMRRFSTSFGFNFAYGESVAVGEPGFDLFPIDGSHTAGGILLRISRDSARTDTVFQVDEDDRVGVGIAPTISFDVKAKSGMTSIGGFAIKLTNETGANTVAGQLVKADTATDDAVILTAAGDSECFGVFLDSGVADAAEAWVVIAGIADVAMQDNTTATRGNWVETSDTEAGYANATTASPPAAPAHFEEIGHCIENVTAGGGGTHILARCVLHFN